MGAGRADVLVTSQSPSNGDHPCMVEERDNKYFAKIFPTEIGKYNKI